MDTLELGGTTPVERASVVCASCGTAFPKGLVTRCPRDGDTPKKAGHRAFHPLIGQTLAGRYRILYLLGRGAMATVFGAEHTAIGRAVALKVLDPSTSRQPDVVPRFQREAKASSRIESPHVVRLLDFGEAGGGLLYLAMELVEGPTLAAELRAHGAMPWREAARIGRDVALALAAAHAAGVVHRDLKPDNVALAGAKRVVKVLDFGIAKIVQRDDDSAGAEGGRAEKKLTMVGTIVGTPGYMSPEAIAHEPVDARSDLYALGATLFELCAGRPPFVEPARAAMLAHHLKTPAPALCDVAPSREIPAALETLIGSLLAKRPDDRPADAVVVASTLSALIGEPLPHVPGASVPPEGEPAASALPTMRIDPDELPQEVRPTLKLESDLEDRTLLDVQELVPTAVPRRAGSTLATWLIAIGATAVLVLAAALVWVFAQSASRDGSGADLATEPRVPTLGEARRTEPAFEEIGGRTQAHGIDAGADLAVRGAAPSGTAARPPATRTPSTPPRPVGKRTGTARPRGGLDIERDYRP
ncbi:MAG: serine/threonine protein kinase [Deltaproteobacteria bacterium]|nr:serine/threonine protein kinase [Deltaproteobacteria bacterium]